MPKRLVFLTLILLGITHCAFAQVDNSEDRKTRLKDNLLFLFPQLNDHFVSIQDLSESTIEGMEIGQFIIDGQQQQLFMTTPDDKTVYLLAAGPFDLSKTASELAIAQKEREEEEKQRAAEIFEAMNPSIANMPSKGEAEAPVTIIEFSDFQCPYCANAAQTIGEVLDRNAEKVRLVYVQFPLESIHPWARSASIASLCAANQSFDAFWTLHDKYFENQKELDSVNLIDKSRTFLSGTGVDMESWAACAADSSTDAYKTASSQVDEAIQLGLSQGVQSTPWFFINGYSISGAQPPEVFQELIDKALTEN